MPEYTHELRAEVDAAMAMAPFIAPEICDAGDYGDFDGTGIVILDDDMRIAAFHQHKDAAAYVAAVNAIAPYTAHIDAQAERIAELEAENARLRELMADVDSISDAIDESFDADWTSRDGAQHVVWWFEAENARAALKDTAQ